MAGPGRPARRGGGCGPGGVVRIIAGEHRGRRIDAPKGEKTRPTSDRVRENAFNLIGPVDDATVLDLFAGSGALGLEALSRGAASCVFVESDRDACRVDQRESRHAPPARDGAVPRRVQRAGGRAAASTTSCSATRRTTSRRTRGSRRTWRACWPRTACSSTSRRRAASRRRFRRSMCEPPACTARRDSPSSPDDHRDLPRHLRPRHERAPRRDRARRADLRPARRRRRRQSAPQDADVHGPGAGRLPARGARRARRTSRSTSSASSSSTSPAAGRLA